MARLRKDVGGIHFAVTTANAEAQDFINQGVYHLHCLDHREAERSFRQAAWLDSRCAMAYWGMALANLHDEKLARRYLNAALKRQERSDRETLYLEALDDYLKAGAAQDRQRRIAYARTLERIAYSHADDPEARAFLALQLLRNDRAGVPLSSRLAMDALLWQILDVNPAHPCHHHRILLWSTEQPELALSSARRCRQLAASDGHMGHLAARIFAPLGRFEDAAWCQEASVRVQHSYALGEGLLPDQIPGYARNRQWLARTLARMGRPFDAAAIAQDMIALPRHPAYNSAAQPGSTYHGRRCLREVLSEFELWDELIALAPTFDGKTEESAREQIAWLLALGRAHFRKGLQLQQAEPVSAGRAALAQLEKRPAKTAEAPQLRSAIAELKGLDALAAGETDLALRLLKEARSDPLLLAWAHFQAGKPAEAESLLQQQVEQRPGEVLPLAHLVRLRWEIGRRDEAELAFRELRTVADQADLGTPALTRLAGLAQQWGYPEDWRIPTQPLAERERPPLSSLGPERWQPAKAPEWSLADAQGRKWSLVQMRGKPVLLIFYLGAGCLHCVEQLQAFAPKVQYFQAAGITIIGISTENVPTLKKALDRFGEKFPFLLLSGSSLEVFKAYGIHDDFEGKPLHGTFLVDPEGYIRWLDRGHEPFADAAFVLAESRRLLKRVSVPAADKVEDSRTEPLQKGNASGQ
jgi:peroxiredoxin